MQTPAVNKFGASAISQRSFQPVSAPSQQQHGSQAGNQALSKQPQQMQTTGKPATETLKPIERAAKTINEMLNQESRYPELDNYIGRKFCARG